MQVSCPSSVLAHLSTAPRLRPSRSWDRSLDCRSRWALIPVGFELSWSVNKPLFEIYFLTLICNYCVFIFRRALVQECFTVNTIRERGAVFNDVELFSDAEMIKYNKLINRDLRLRKFQEDHEMRELASKQWRGFRWKKYTLKKYRRDNLPPQRALLLQ